MLRALKREYEESKERASTRIQSVYRCYVRFRAHTTTKRAMMKLQSHFAKLKREREFKQVGDLRASFICLPSFLGAAALSSVWPLLCSTV